MIFTKITVINPKKMDVSAVTCWYDVFLDAYKYSSKYLIFSLSVMLMSIFMMWAYEKPQLYKLIYKRSKLSNISSPVQSVESLEENCIQNMQEDSYIFKGKKSRELSKDEIEF